MSVTSPFAFHLGQRVNVPHPMFSGAQALVTLPRFARDGKVVTAPRPATGEHQYYLSWVDNNGVGMDGWFYEAELLAANVPVFVFAPGDDGHQLRRVTING